jgi:hypothetical protein
MVIIFPFPPGLFPYGDKPEGKEAGRAGEAAYFF